MQTLLLQFAAEAPSLRSPFVVVSQLTATASTQAAKSANQPVHRIVLYAHQLLLGRFFKVFAKAVLLRFVIAVALISSLVHFDAGAADDATLLAARCYKATQPVHCIVFHGHQPTVLLLGRFA